MKADNPPPAPFVIPAPRIAAGILDATYFQ